MTKKEAINAIKNMNFSTNDVEALIEIIVNLDYDSYIIGYCQGYEDYDARALHEYGSLTP